MAAYKIEYIELHKWLQGRVKNLPKGKIQAGNSLLKASSNLLDELHSKNFIYSMGTGPVYEIHEKEEEIFSDPLFYITQNEEQFPSALSLQLLMLNYSEIKECLKYHSEKFESNKLVSRVNFETFLKAYVIPYFKIYAFTLGYIKTDRLKRENEINTFIKDIDVSTGDVKIDFRFEKNEKEKIIKALKRIVDYESFSRLGAFFSDSQLKRKINFIVPPILITDLFKGFLKNGNIPKGAITRQQLAFWLSQRVAIKKKKRKESYWLKLLKSKSTKFLNERILVNEVPC